jgi:hypothetical protein
MGLQLPLIFCNNLLFLELQFEWICYFAATYPRIYTITPSLVAAP